MFIRKFRSPDRDALIALWQTIYPDDPPHNEPAALLRRLNGWNVRVP